MQCQIRKISLSRELLRVAIAKFKYQITYIDEKNLTVNKSCVTNKEILLIKYIQNFI